MRIHTHAVRQAGPPSIAHTENNDIMVLFVLARARCMLAEYIYNWRAK